MSESRKHMELVQVAYEYIKTKVPADQQALIEVDSAEAERPTIIRELVIPDVQFLSEDLLIIGEAKTLEDFDRKHSKKQYDAYFNECKSFNGKALFVISIPWQLVMTAKNYFRRKKQENSCEFDVVVLNEIGGVFIV